MYYYLLFTTKRVVIVANDNVNEYSTSYGYSELGSIRVIKGILKDKIKIKSESFVASKHNVKKIAIVSDYINFELRIWKYPVFLGLVFLLALGLFKAYYYLEIYKYFLLGPSPSEVIRPVKKKKVLTSFDASLKDITDGYLFVYKQILKHYPIYIKHPSSTGAPSLSFDQWARDVVLSSLDAQDAKLSSLNLSLQKHIMVKVEISDLRLLIMRLLDTCKKSFKKKKEAKKIKEIKKEIDKKFEAYKKNNALKIEK